MHNKNISDFVELPAKRSQETQKSPPMFCTKCQEIRGVGDEDGTVMGSTPERLYWNSFEMCGRCYLFLRDHTSDAETNKKLYKQKIKIKEEQIQREIDSKKFRIYFVEKSDKLLNSDFINSVSKVKFHRYPVEKNNKLITKSKELVKEEIAQGIVTLILSKDIYSWYERE